jgi:hypothetical protein
MEPRPTQGEASDFPTTTERRPPIREDPHGIGDKAPRNVAPPPVRVGIRVGHGAGPRNVAPP